uniref:Glutathione transferase n=1 Tax=Aedes aegypti TaxID=7159 RepID=UPI001E6A10DE|nr:Chain A, Glutathione transferase [Aedes aegypti]7EBT_B Chain B, Glutathione transferase [Aedes aegypti]7EBT_C Chain C, Glutathione transferase [Aedes aegypti]7EBT_D Chain D, Glutathione transferase [Aedes aegypti]7EBU_A Chain A, Glutathione transferase [Aedes aegypti]7EBU_B Chain B, Glutathione transferase [Aedes aegypti]7EBU_C Chain C, Glutathione transferase [Aedes aegypti]7EBU_D Chain D, Glutathione transferase [Aedes aegypti]7EBV_A Chain A, Glutathione transferase [Aedes aegypti]7EB
MNHKVHMMSKPVLYYDDISPPVRGVLLTVAALGIKDQVELKLVRLFEREHLLEDFVKLNPLHAVPVLKHDDLVLTDSHAIIMYLCDIFGQDGDFSLKDPKQRARVHNRLCFNNAVLFQRESIVMRGLINRSIVTLEDHHLKPVQEAYDCLEVYLTNSKFVACDQLTVADFPIVACMSTVGMVCPLSTSRWPKTAAWFETMKQLPYYQQANQVGVDKLKERLHAVMKK